MEFTWAILMVLGIFIGMPLLVSAIGGVYALVPWLASRAKTAKAEKATEVLHPQSKAYEDTWDWDREVEHLYHLFGV